MSSLPNPGGFSASMLEQFYKRYEHLPQIYLPPDRSKERTTRPVMIWRRLLLQHLPASSIPRGLKLKRGYNFQPPKFDYGWGVTQEQLMAIADRGGFSVYHKLTGHRRAANPNAKPDLDPDFTVGKLNRVLKDRFPDKFTSYEMGRVDVEMVVDRSAKDGFLFCLTLANSYRTGNRKPSVEIIATLREFFGIDAQEEPMWYLDSLYPSWRWLSSYEYNLETALYSERTKRTTSELVPAPPPTGSDSAPSGVENPQAEAVVTVE